MYCLCPPVHKEASAANRTSVLHSIPPLSKQCHLCCCEGCHRIPPITRLYETQAADLRSCPNVEVCIYVAENGEAEELDFGRRSGYSNPCHLGWRLLNLRPGQCILCFEISIQLLAHRIRQFRTENTTKQNTIIVPLLATPASSSTPSPP